MWRWAAESRSGVPLQSGHRASRRLRKLRIQSITEATPKPIIMAAENVSCRVKKTKSAAKNPTRLM